MLSTPVGLICHQERWRFGHEKEGKLRRPWQTRYANLNNNYELLTTLYLAVRKHATFSLQRKYVGNLLNRGKNSAIVYPMSQNREDWTFIRRTVLFCLIWIIQRSVYIFSADFSVLGPRFLVMQLYARHCIQTSSWQRRTVKKAQARA